MGQINGRKIFNTLFLFSMCAEQRDARRKKIPSEFSITQQQGLVDFLVFVFANYANFSPDIVI